MKIYFDDVLVNEDYYMSYKEDFSAFTDTFYLGSTASVMATLKVPLEAWNPNIGKVQIFIDDELTRTFMVDKSEIQDDATVVMTLGDYLLRTDDTIDISSLITEEHGVTAKTLLEFICDNYSIPYTSFSFTNQDVEINSYDSTLTGRQYLEMIAEIAGSYVRINNQGQLELRDYVLSQDYITTEDIDSYKEGELNTIGRVVYDDGITEPKKSSDDTSLYTIYLNINNLFLQVINQTQFDAICNKIIGYQFANIKINNCNKFFEPGSTISLIKEDNTSIPFICSYSKNYFGDYVGSYETDIQSQERTETQVIPEPDRIRKIGTVINQINGTLTIQSQEISDLNNTTASLQIGLDNIQNLFQITGGSNLIKNSQFLLADERWNFISDPYATGVYHTELGAGYNASLIGSTVAVANIILRNIIARTTNNNIINLKTNTPHSMSFTLSQDPNTTTVIKLTGVVSGEDVISETITTVNDGIDMEDYSFQFIPRESNYILSIESNTLLDGYVKIYDLMLNQGDIKSWEPASSEVYSTILKMSQMGMQVYSSGSKILTLITTDGFQIREAHDSGQGEIIIGNPISEFDNQGITTQTVNMKKAVIGKYVQTEMELSGIVHHVEYFQE